MKKDASVVELTIPRCTSCSAWSRPANLASGTTAARTSTIRRAFRRTTVIPSLSRAMPFPARLLDPDVGFLNVLLPQCPGCNDVGRQIFRRAADRARTHLEDAGGDAGRMHGARDRGGQEPHHRLGRALHCRDRVPALRLEIREPFL